MKAETLRGLDRASTGLLCLWALFALAVLPFPASPDTLLRVADWSAWGAFGGAALLSWLSRWMNEVSDEIPIGPLQLWGAALLAALLLCFASSAIVGPRLRELKVLADPELQPAMARAKSLAVQFLLLRLALACGLAWGVRRLPVKVRD